MQNSTWASELLTWSGFYEWFHWCHLLYQMILKSSTPSTVFILEEDMYWILLYLKMFFQLKFMVCILNYTHAQSLQYMYTTHRTCTFKFYCFFYVSFMLHCAFIWCVSFHT